MAPLAERNFGIDPANGRELRYLQLVAAVDLRVELLPSTPFVCLVAWHVERAMVDHVITTLLDAGASYVSAFGQGCELLHDCIDETVVMRNIDRDRDAFPDRARLFETLADPVASDAGYRPSDEDD